MYIIPGYVDIHSEQDAILLTSQLLQNQIRITGPPLQEELRSILERGSCNVLSTPLTQFLHEQEMLLELAQIEAALEEAKQLLSKGMSLTIMPTEACNFRCPYCYEDHTPVSMSQDIAEQIKSYIAAQAPRFERVNISWFGGEPTLCKELVLNVARFVQSVQSANSFDYVSQMTTNGYLLTVDAFKEYYAAGITKYQITVDGWTHDETRPHVSGKGTLQTILKNLQEISALPEKDYNFYISLRHNILADDRDYSWYDHLKSLFGKDARFSVFVYPVGNLGDTPVQGLELLTDKNRDALINEHIAYLDKISMNHINHTGGAFSKVCYACYPNGFVFRADGKIGKCTVALNNPSNIVGYVDSNSGVVLDENVNNQWCISKLRPECFACMDLLRCLNLQCGRRRIASGGTDTPCAYMVPRAKV